MGQSTWGLRWQIQEHCITGIMKLLLLFAAIVYTSAAVTCDECKDAAAGLVDRLTSEASIAEQTEVLIAALWKALAASPERDCVDASSASSSRIFISSLAIAALPPFIAADSASARRPSNSPSWFERELLEDPMDVTWSCSA